jgi:predicted lipoprotein with Yx(FWY)xxD motif
MPAREEHAGAGAGSRRGVFAAALMALLGVVGYLAASGSLALGATQSHATVTLRSTSLGKVLVTASGRTLYLFMADKNGKSACAGQCAKFWPPLLDSAKPTAGAGVKASLLGRTRRADGKMQVTYNRHPLYTFSLDKSAGQVNGEGINHFGGLWWAVSAKGVAIKKSTGTSNTTTSSTTTNYVPPPYP